MDTIDQLLDAVKAKNGIKSDYKLAFFTGKTQNTIANYRHGRSRPDDKTLSELAALADIPKSEIQLMAVRFQVERAANDDSRELWSGIAARLQAGFANVQTMILLAMFSIAAAALPAWATLYFASFSVRSVCILC